MTFLSRARAFFVHGEPLEHLIRLGTVIEEGWEKKEEFLSFYFLPGIVAPKSYKSHPERANHMGFVYLIVSVPGKAI